MKKRLKEEPVKPALNLFLCVLIASAVAGCGADSSTDEGTVQPLLVDGAHHHGTPGFFFLPPLVPPTSYGKTFSAGLSPVVLIDELGSRSTIATFTKTSGLGNARVIEGKGFYYVVWQTRLSQLDPNLIYRVHVQLQGVELGLIDLKVVASIRELIDFYRTRQWNDYAPVFRDLPLLIPFRIEPAALACVGVACAPLDQCHAAGQCDPRTGACSNPPKPDGAACDDGNSCTQRDACQAGSCMGETVNNCITEFAIPTADSGPLWIAKGSDGNLWFTEYRAGKIGRITPTGIVTEFAIPSPDSGPWGIVEGPDGNLWFTEFSAGKIASITTSGIVTEFTIPSADGFPNGITAGPDGNLWFTEFPARRIGRFVPDGSITEFAIPTANSDPLSIAAGSDGNLWFTEELASTIGRVTADGSTFAEFAIPSADSYPYGIAAGPDGNLWFTEFSSSIIGRVTPADGGIKEFAIPTANSGPVWIAQGPDGNLWFTEDLANKIGRITPAGIVTEFAIPTASSGSWVIVTGPDSNLWFTEFQANKIGRVTP